MRGVSMALARFHGLGKEPIARVLPSASGVGKNRHVSYSVFRISSPIPISFPGNTGALSTTCFLALDIATFAEGRCLNKKHFTMLLQIAAFSAPLLPFAQQAYFCKVFIPTKIPLGNLGTTLARTSMAFPPIHKTNLALFPLTILPVTSWWVIFVTGSVSRCKTCTQASSTQDKSAPVSIHTRICLIGSLLYTSASLPALTCVEGRSTIDRGLQLQGKSGCAKPI